MASRSMWKGSISFGLVNIPAKVYLATENREFSFNQLCPNGHRIQYKKWCPIDEKEIGYADVKKGYQVSKGSYIAIDKKDYSRLQLLLMLYQKTITKLRMLYQKTSQYRLFA
jgi:DNA end-binding protein Ku